ncbi:hypothetical protein DPMN_043448 [Dreissena polymorpha]|uniref:Uncharacterized protein n=1 Tax=Dreissena polymorpha TaxID=45954 RepID=A0A9D4D0I6_DREPO|nr:hypothetical protein DPMN_043448 [Dreissena polymorpha]
MAEPKSVDNEGGIYFYERNGSVMDYDDCKRSSEKSCGNRADVKGPEGRVSGSDFNRNLDHQWLSMNEALKAVARDIRDLKVTTRKTPTEANC